ncbi:ABC transporter permease [Salinisphaera sp.]|uniref:ABC transporter permease n=1 Tax=Salinisphaera sp. TaxID=1914330 RepID=UPI002D77E963|nr:ABC transporter permease [Salinisphaera sp.]HET7313087.1 ABC transporter permease [Salinisphaera sp.]
MSTITQRSAKPDDRRGHGLPPRLSRFLRDYSTLLIFVVLIIGASFASDSFLSVHNIGNVMRQTAGIGLMSIGMLFVILTRGIDLSVGAILALGSVVSAILLQYFPLAVAIPLTIGSGALLGAVSGFGVAFMRLPSFIVTLAMMSIARGVSLIISDGRPIMVSDNGMALLHFGSGYLFGVPYPVWLMLAMFVAAGVVHKYMRFGRVITAIGSNEQAVHLSGVRVRYYTFAVYLLSGALAALAGIISASRAGVGSASIGVGAELDVIAAVVIGGASLTGGKGTVFNTLIGVLVFGVIGNIMNLMNISGYDQEVVMGVIILIAIMLQARLYRARHY